MTNEAAVEKEIQAKGLNAPRLTPDLIDSVIKAKEFHVFKPSMDTVCNITLKNGFTVRGYASCVSAENYNRELGEKIAFENARKEVWQLEAYLLAQQLYPTEAVVK